MCLYSSRFKSPTCADYRCTIDRIYGNYNNKKKKKIKNGIVDTRRVERKTDDGERMMKVDRLAKKLDAVTFERRIYPWR